MIDTASTIGWHATLGQEAIRRWFLGSPSSTFAHSTDSLFMFITWICTGWFVLLMGMMFYFVFKYRRRPGVPAQRSPAHNTPLELAWSIVPLMFLIPIFFWGYFGYADKNVAPVGAEEITIKAYRWAWEATYDNGGSPREWVHVGNTEAPVIYVPAGKPVKLRMYSTDVIHSFWIPDFRIKRDVFPNRYTSQWFQADEPLGPDDRGHMVFCAEYCGDSHSEMMAIIKPVPVDQYKAIKAKIVGLDDSWTPVQVGEFVWKKNCRSCHTLDGARGTGPTWKDLFGKTEEFEDGSTAHVDENYVRESVMTPGKRIVRGFPNQMTTFLLSDKELEGVIALMKSISVHAPKSADTPPPDGNPNTAPGTGGEGEPAAPTPSETTPPAPVGG